MKVDLTPKQRSYLKSLGQHLKATVWIGKNDITDQVISAIETEFEHTELVKIKMLDTSGTEKRTAGQKLADMSETTLVQVIGRVVLLYSPFKEKRVIKLPQ
jgi:RNA-binding protein